MNPRKAGQNPSGSSKERIRALATEKARLELLVSLMTRLSREKGLNQVVNRSLEILTAVIGSTNASICYQQDSVFHCTDLFKKQRTLDRLQDPAVISAWQKRKPVQIESA